MNSFSVPGTLELDTEDREIPLLAHFKSSDGQLPKQFVIIAQGGRHAGGLTSGGADSRWVR